MTSKKEEFLQLRRQKKTDVLITAGFFILSIFLLSIWGCGEKSLSPLEKQIALPESLNVDPNEIAEVLADYYLKPERRAGKLVLGQQTIPTQFDIVIVAKEMIGSRSAQVLSEFLLTTQGESKSGVVGLYYELAPGQVWERNRSIVDVIETKDVFGIVGTLIFDAIQGDPISGARVFFRRLSDDPNAQPYTSESKFRKTGRLL